MFFDFTQIINNDSIKNNNFYDPFVNFIFNTLPQSYNINNINNLSKISEINSFENTLWWVNSWFYTYNCLILLIFLLTIVFLIGLFIPKTPKNISILNVLGAISIFLFLILLPIPHYISIKNLIWSDYNMYVYLYIIISGLFTASFLIINNEVTFLKENKHIEYPILILLIYISGIVVISSENFIAVFLALESITLISAVLIGFQRTNSLSTLASIRYIFFSAVPGGALVLGISELYAYTGAFNFSDIEKLLIQYDLSFLYEYSINTNLIENIIFNSIEIVNNNSWDLLFNYYLQNLEEEFLSNFYVTNNQFSNIILNSQNNQILKQFINYNFYNNENQNLSDTILAFEGKSQNLTLEQSLKKNKYIIYKIINFCQYDTNANILIAQLHSKELFDSIQNSNVIMTASPILNISEDINMLYKDNINNKLLIDYKVNSFYNFEKFLLNNNFENTEYLSKFNLKIENLINNTLDYLQLINSKLNTINNIELIGNKHAYTKPLIINIAIFLIIFYILFKLTAAPFHFWAPSIYEGAPLPITIFLSIFSKITMMFLLLKLLTFYFYFLYSDWSFILIFSGIASIIVGIYGAISETRIKRFFVYSSMGHVGFMLLGAAIGGFHGVVATILYLIVYTVTVFIGWIVLFSSNIKITHINQLNGLSIINPSLSFIMAISMLSMSGIPPLGGFFVKFEILYALIESEYYSITFIALILTVISFFYYLRIIKILYFEPLKSFKLQIKLNKTQSILLTLCFLFLILFTLYFQQPIIYYIKNIILQVL